MQAAFAVIQTIAKPELVTSGLSFIMIGNEKTKSALARKLGSSMLTQACSSTPQRVTSALHLRSSLRQWCLEWTRTASGWALSS